MTDEMMDLRALLEKAADARAAVEIECCHTTIEASVTAARGGSRWWTRLLAELELYEQKLRRPQSRSS